MTAISPPVPVDADANAHRPSAVPTTAVGLPGTSMVTGRCAASSLPAATLAEQPALKAAAARCGKPRTPEEQPATMMTAPADATAARQRL
jgi:hypothetical protein